KSLLSTKTGQPHPINEFKNPKTLPRLGFRAHPRLSALICAYLRTFLKKYNRPLIKNIKRDPCPVIPLKTPKNLSQLFKLFLSMLPQPFAPSHLCAFALKSCPPVFSIRLVSAFFFCQQRHRKPLTYCCQKQNTPSYAKTNGLHFRRAPLVEFSRHTICGNLGGLLRNRHASPTTQSASDWLCCAFQRQ
ncbi:MAG TPA: hypothetical protein VGI88_01210, partial [Verrucomicrobiae bacterium]